MLDSRPKNQQRLSVRPPILFPCRFVHSGCFLLAHLPRGKDSGGVLRGVTQVKRALHGLPRTLHSQPRGAAVAVSLMAHRHRNLSQSQSAPRSLRQTSSQMHSGPLYPQPASTRRLGILPLSLTRTVVFKQHRGMHAISDL